MKVEGSGKNGFMVIVQEQDYTQHSKSKLTEVLRAMKMDIQEDVFIAAFSHREIPSIDKLMSKNQCNKVLIFTSSVDFVDLNANASFYNVMRFENYDVLIAEPITVIMADSSKKARLWKSIQSAFLK